MNTTRIEFLPRDHYDFLECGIDLRSNSMEMMAHFRSMYARFYQGSDSGGPGPLQEGRGAGRLTIEVIDELAASNRLVVRDGRHVYRLSRSGEDFYFTRQNLHTRSQDLSGYCDPFTLLQAGVLTSISQASDAYHLIHAGVVSWQDRGVIIVGTSGMGKTTLVLKLVMQGCKFLSDEVAWFDSKLEAVEPFPRKLNIRREAQSLLGLPLKSEAADHSFGTEEPLWMVDIEEIAPNNIGARCKPRYLLFPQGFGEKPRLEYVSKSNALFTLMRSCIEPTSDLGSLLFNFSGLMNDLECYNLVMGSPEETAERVMELVGGTDASTG
jgi:hypothetical protein